VIRRLRRAAAALFVVAAALFTIGVAIERDSHTEATEAHHEAAQPAGHDETGEAGEHDVAAEAAGGDEAAKTTSNAAAGEAEHGAEGTVLGVDAESTAAIAAAIAVSVALAVGLWFLNRRWLALLAVAFGIVFAVFDIAEIIHQINESRAGLAVLAGLIAALHLAASATAELSNRPVQP
jgi:hypothetical protein